MNENENFFSCTIIVTEERLLCVQFRRKFMEIVGLKSVQLNGDLRYYNASHLSSSIFSSVFHSFAKSFNLLFSRMMMNIVMILN